MRFLSWTFARAGMLLALGMTALGGGSAEAQTYYPQTGGSGTWGGYFPNNPWSGYAPGSAWVPYAPGTSTAGVIVQPPNAITGTVPPAAPGVYPNATTRPVYTYVQPAVPRRNLINGVDYPVRGPTPYADGRPRTYYEYGTGRQVRLAKPWLPGAPGGR